MIRTIPASDLIQQFIKDEWDPLLESYEKRLKKEAALAEKVTLKPAEQAALSKLEDQTLKLRQVKADLFRLSHGAEMIILTADELLQDCKSLSIFDGELLQPDLTAEQRGVLQKHLKGLHEYLAYYEKKDLEKPQ